MIDVVNERDEVVGSADRPEIYASRLPHRIVHILVRDKSGRTALQLRSASVSFCPLHWCTAAGGHVRSGETYEEAARRESAEELGIEMPLRFIGVVSYDGLGLKKFLGVFEATFDGPFLPDPNDVAKVAFFEDAELRAMTDDPTVLMHPELKFLLKRS